MFFLLIRVSCLCYDIGREVRVMLKYYKNTVLYYDHIKTGIGIITGWKKPNLIREHLTQESLNKVSRKISL